MKSKTIEYQGLDVEVYFNDTKDLWTAYMNHAIYDIGDDIRTERLELESDREPTQDEIDQLLCLELGI